MTDELPPLPERLIGAVDRYADEVYEYNVAVKLDVGINEAGKICLAAEAKYQDQVRAYGDARAVAATERAAQVCDEHASIEGIAQKCAAAIRAAGSGSR